MKFTVEEQEWYLEYYLGNEMRRLREMCMPMLTKFGGLSDMDYDDFFSLAAQTLWNTLRKYDSDCNVPYPNYLASCIDRKNKSEMSRRNRAKRATIIEVEDEYTGETVLEYIKPISIDSLDETSLIRLSILDKFITVGDVIDDVLAKEEQKENFTNRKLDEYMSTLSKRERKIVHLLSKGYTPTEIQKALVITNKQYNEHLKNIRSYERVQILY